jgi:hypothetical protein
MKYLADVGAKWERKMQKEDKLWKNRNPQKKKHFEIPDDNKQGDITEEKNELFRQKILGINSKK